MKKNLVKVFMAGLMVLNSAPVIAGDSAVGEWLNKNDIPASGVGWSAGLGTIAASYGANRALNRRIDNEPIAGFSNGSPDHVVARASAPFYAQRNELTNRMSRLSHEISVEKDRLEVMRKIPNSQTVQTETETAAHLEQVDTRSGFFRPHVSTHSVDSASDTLVTESHYSGRALAQARKVERLELQMAKLKGKFNVVSHKINEVPVYLSSRAKTAFLTEEDCKALNAFHNEYAVAAKELARQSEQLGKQSVKREKIGMVTGIAGTAGAFGLGILSGATAEIVKYEAYTARAEKAQAESAAVSQASESNGASETRLLK